MHIDLVGPLPPSGGHTHILTIMDRSTRWPEAVPISDTSARAVAEAFLQTWVARFGVPSTLTSDRGPQFTSALWAELCRLLGVDHVQTTAFHPQSNGLLERFHRRLKDALRARATRPSWAAQLPLIMLFLRATPREDVQRSPAEAVYGSQVVLPGQLLLAGADPPEGFFLQLERAMAGFAALPTRHNTSEGVLPPADPPETLMAASRVFVRRDGARKPLEPLWEGPFRVLQRSRHVFRIQRGSREDNVSVLRLKPADVPASCPDGQPKLRGRPKSVRLAL